MYKFLILDDLYFALEKFDLIEQDYLENLITDVVHPFRNEIINQFRNIELCTLDSIRNRTSSIFNEDYFFVTLEDGVFFRSYHFNLKISRIVSKPEYLINGPYILDTRIPELTLQKQLTSLVDLYIRTGNSRPIVLCDDGIGKYGITLLAVINMLKKESLNVVKIYVYLNEFNVQSLSGIEITTIYKHSDYIYFLNERDLYWGLPKSGITCKTKDDIYLGVPYSYNSDLVQNKFKYILNRENDFRKICLKYNRIFWQQIELFNKSPIFFSDCSRLRALPNFFSIPNSRIVDFIDKSLHS